MFDIKRSMTTQNIAEVTQLLDAVQSQWHSAQ